MPLILDLPQSGSGAATIGLRSADCINIGLINNMPDAALEATERQFTTLLRDAAASRAVVRLTLFAIPQVPRAEHVRRGLGGRYRDVSELRDSRLDALIVTGTEARAANLKDEPYWTALTKIIDWARENTASAIWSCLAAHAAVLHADGIERRPLAEKQFGVFDCDLVADDRLTKGAARRLRVPHSRYNDLPEAALTSCGYRLLTRSAAAGVDMFTKEERDLSLFVFFQGHPEYETDTLLREYRRDVGRFLRGEREDYPAMPHGYFGDAAAAIASDFRARALRDRSSDLAADFPMGALEGGLADTWRRAAVVTYANWLDYLRNRKAKHRAPSIRLRGPWRWSSVPARPAADGSSAG